MLTAISGASKHPYKYAKNQIKKKLFYLLQITLKVIIIYYNNIFQEIYKKDNTTEGKEGIRRFHKEMLEYDFKRRTSILHHHFTSSSPIKLQNKIDEHDSEYSMMLGNYIWFCSSLIHTGPGTH